MDWFKLLQWVRDVGGPYTVIAGLAASGVAWAIWKFKIKPDHDDWTKREAHWYAREAELMKEIRDLRSWQQRIANKYLSLDEQRKERGM